MSGGRSCSGRLFHSVGPAVAKPNWWPIGTVPWYTYSFDVRKRVVVDDVDDHFVRVHCGFRRRHHQFIHCCLGVRFLWSHNPDSMFVSQFNRAVSLKDVCTVHAGSDLLHVTTSLLSTYSKIIIVIIIIMVRSERHHFCSNVFRCRCSVLTLFFCTTLLWSTTVWSRFNFNFFLLLTLGNYTPKGI